MKVEALNCPNCGAGVASDRQQCQFCKTRLKTVGCAKCLGLMFAGSKFCGHCGAVAAPVSEAVDADLGDCPRCRRGLEALDIQDVRIGGCSGCDGLWVDVQTFENVCASQEKQSAVLGFLRDRHREPQQLKKVNYVPCPACGHLMNRSNFGRASGVIIDICKRHGVFFDADELPKIIDFIQQGGMELARQREKNELKDERDRLHEDKRRQAAFDRRFANGDAWESGDQSPVRTFVRNLFD